MPDTPAVSVIIPLYNAEKYIGECLESLLAQTFKNFEVVVVSDCPTDKSRDVAESYIPKFGGRMRIFDNKKNSGPSASRNNGLRLAIGEYVHFMDADDTFAPNALEEMYNYAKKFDVDFVSCTKFNRMSADGKEITLVDLNPNLDKEVVDENISQRVEQLLKDKFGRDIWLRLLRRDFLIENEIFFPEDVEYAENQIWVHGLLFCAKKILYLPRAYYFYRYKTKNSIIWKKRDTFQIMNVRLRAVIHGLKWIDDVMGTVEFFRRDSQLRHKILDHFTRRFFNGFFSRSLECSQPEIFASVNQEFGKDLGEYAVLISTLCTLVNTNQKTIDRLKKKLNNK